MRVLWALGALLVPALALGGVVSGLPAPMGALHGTFVQAKTVQGLSRPVVSCGDFALLPDRGLVWRIVKPLHSTVVLTTDGVFVLDGTRPHRLSSGAEALQLMREILTGDAGALGRVFEVRRGQMAKGWRLTLTPKPGPMAAIFKNIEAEGGAFAQMARLRESSGDETLIRFEAVRAGTGPMDKAEESLLGL